MRELCESGLRYCVLDPTGNITALVETAVDVAQQPEVAASIMLRHPEVEQVGFVRFALEATSGVDVELRMAGGEFCGNASLCAAALYVLRVHGDSRCVRRVMLKVSGATNPVAVVLEPEGSGAFSARVAMPRELGVIEQTCRFEGTVGSVPLVLLEGISHMVIEPASAFFKLLDERDRAERAVRQWCTELDAECLGLMFLEQSETQHHLTPLVYVSGGDTLFWENSCASGSSAVGMHLAEKAGERVDVTLCEPGGVLRVTSDPATHETWLFGHVC